MNELEMFFKWINDNCYFRGTNLTVYGKSGIDNIPKYYQEKVVKNTVELADIVHTFIDVNNEMPNKTEMVYVSINGNKCNCMFHSDIMKFTTFYNMIIEDVTHWKYYA